MIKGTGIDLVEINRFSEAVDKGGENFLARIFTGEERERYGKTVFRLAARFAAKEAMLKAMGLGLWAVPLTDMEILSEESGKPVMNIYGKMKDLAAQAGVEKIHLTISHSAFYAIAQVVLE